MHLLPAPLGFRVIAPGVLDLISGHTDLECTPLLAGQIAAPQKVPRGSPPCSSPESPSKRSRRRGGRCRKPTEVRFRAYVL
eukprot:33801-Rhodomonas_salina.3